MFLLFLQLLPLLHPNLFLLLAGRSKLSLCLIQSRNLLVQRFCLGHGFRLKRGNQGGQASLFHDHAPAEPHILRLVAPTSPLLLLHANNDVLANDAPEQGFDLLLRDILQQE